VVLIALAVIVACAMSLTDAQGGFAVPLTLDPSINITSSGNINSLRAVSKVARSRVK
jgi:hypothetical protein